MRKPWFAPKRYGYGAGLPISWEGWAVLGGYFILMLTAALVLEYAHSPYRFLVIIPMAMATIAVIWVAKTRTRGGWRWRRGSED